MSEEQFALPTFVQRTAIVGVRNIYDYPDALLELQDTFKRSLHLIWNLAESEGLHVVFQPVVDIVGKFVTSVVWKLSYL